MQTRFILTLANLPLTVKILLLGLIYWLFCWIGTYTFYRDFGIAIYWPAAGIAILGIYIFGRFASAGIFIAAFIFNYFVYSKGYHSQSGLLISVAAIAGANTLGAIIGSRCLSVRVLKNNRSFFRLNSILAFLLFVVLIPSLLTSITGGSVTYFYGVAPDFFYKAHSWLLADLTGILVIVPLGISWLEDPCWKVKRNRIFEFVLILFLLITTGYMIFTDFFGNYIYNFLLAYFTTPIYLWLSLRYDSKTVTTVQFFSLIGISYLAIYSGNDYLGSLVEKPYILLQGFSILIFNLILIVHGIFMERQQTLISLHKSEEDLKDVLVNLPLGLGILNTSFDPLFLNKEFTEKTGLNLADFKTQVSTKQTAPPLNRMAFFLQNAWESFIEKLKTEPSRERDISLHTIDHDIREFSLNISPLKDRYLMVMMDVTQRKQLLVRIREDERRLSSLIQNLQGMVYQCRLDRNWTMEFVSEGSFLLTGYLPSDLIYNTRIPFASIIHERFREYVWDTIEKALKRGETYSIQYQIITKNGILKWVAENGNGIFDNDGVCRSLEGFIYDITERIETLEALQMAEKEIRLLNQHLERKVRKRTEDLNRTNQELETFSYTVSHDLKAPLRAVRGFSSLLMDEYGKNLPEGALHYIKNVQKNTENMTNLITDLLHFSRLGSKSIVYTKIDSKNLVTSVLEDLYSYQKPKGIEFIVNDLPFLIADESLITQVFVNLFSNSVKFSKPGINGRIEVSCNTNPEFHEFCVTDEGIGFEQKFEDKIFKVFQRLHTPEEFEGSGVGLALVQRIIHRHGGSIRVKSEPGKGTSIFFTIPVEIET